MLLTQNKASKRSSFPKRQWPVNKPNYEWHSCLQAEHQSLADFWLNGPFSPTNAMALKVTCGNNHWHKLSWELWPGFPWRKKLPQTEVAPGSKRKNSALHGIVQPDRMALLLSMSTHSRPSVLIQQIWTRAIMILLKDHKQREKKNETEITI